MKKVLLILLSVMLVFSLAACNTGGDEVTEPVNVKVEVTADQTGQSAADVLKAYLDAEGTEYVATEDAAMGTYFSSVQGFANDDTNAWMLYVNDVLAEAGASVIVANEGDVIELRWEAYDLDAIDTPEDENVDGVDPDAVDPDAEGDEVVDPDAPADGDEVVDPDAPVDENADDANADDAAVE